jgi:hypothetical protein
MWFVEHVYPQRLTQSSPYRLQALVCLTTLLVAQEYVASGDDW